MICQLIIPLIVGVQAGVLGQGLGTLNRARFPQIPAGAVGSAAQIVRGLLRRQLEPKTVTGPFGNLVVGTADQDLERLAGEAAIRRLNQEVLAELLAEDPLLFIRNLPFGDPRRVAVGLDPPVSVGAAPAPGAPGQVAFPVQVPTTRRRAVRPAVGAPFRTRALRGFAIR